MVDLLADEIVFIGIDQEESDSEGEDLLRDILPCDDHHNVLLTILVIAVSMKL